MRIKKRIDRLERICYNPRREGKIPLAPFCVFWPDRISQSLEAVEDFVRSID
nr:MAG TPA: hypothetical protein [Caudoviricetes sp.]